MEIWLKCYVLLTEKTFNFVNTDTPCLKKAKTSEKVLAKTFSFIILRFFSRKITKLQVSTFLVRIRSKNLPASVLDYFTDRNKHTECGGLDGGMRMILSKVKVERDLAIPLRWCLYGF